MSQCDIFRGSECLQELKEVERLRQQVWSLQLDQTVVASRFALDQYDQKAWHVVTYVDDKIVGSGRVILVDSANDVPDQCSFGTFVEQMKFPVAVMNRLVVHPDYQGMGLAREITNERIAFSRQYGANQVWVEINETRVASMIKKGFSNMGESFDESIPGKWRVICKNL